MAELKEASPWHGMAPDAVLEAVSGHHLGLSQAQAQERLTRLGANRLPTTPPMPAWRRFLMQFHNVLIYVLLAAGLVTLVLGHYVDTAVILGVVLINAVVGFVQEGKAASALAAISRMVKVQAMVLRDGVRMSVAAEALVPGDVVLLQAGDKVAADMRLLDGREVMADESLLTGESVPVSKQVAAVAEQAALAERQSLLHAGTLVTRGQGSAVVVRTGEQTELGRIRHLLAQVNPLETPLVRQMAELARVLTLAILVVAALAFAWGVWGQAQPVDEMFLAVVGLAVAAIPEGLPAVVTITLALGVQRMAGRNAIVRRLPAVEALGSVTVICSDKTGTLTRNEMTVRQLVTADGVYGITGSGLSPEGEIVQGDALVPDAVRLALVDVGRVAGMCNDASVRADGSGGWQLTGDPMEAALLVLSRKLGTDVPEHQLPRQDVLPFASEHRLMVTAHHDQAGHRVWLMKGAPEQVLSLCDHQRQAGEDVRLSPAYWLHQQEVLAAEGMRLLALAMRVTPAGQELTLPAVHQGGFTLLGMVGLQDPPRDEAVVSVQSCYDAGIEVKMITGDHEATARAIGRQLGLSGAVVSGRDLDELDDAELVSLAREAQVFARTTPEHKLRLVTALQASGEVVAMTGDGVNDAPALRRADVGVAMGGRGTDAARDAAEMVLADDRFDTIAAAVAEGRRVYDNLVKAIVFILPTNGGEAGLVLLAIALGLTMPITPAQVLWVNMVTAVTLALALAFEAAEPDVMRRPPRAPDAPLLSGFVLWRLVLVALLMIGLSMSLFHWSLAQGDDLEKARTLAVSGLVMAEVMYLLACRHPFAPFWQDWQANPWVWRSIAALIVVQGAFTYWSPLQQVFATQPLDWQDWGWVLAGSLLVLLVLEVEKALMRRWRPARQVTGRR